MAVLDWLQQLLGGGDPEAAGAAQASTAMQPMTQPWLDKVLSGEMARGGIQDVNDAFASGDPVALAGSFGPSPLGIRAYHGSPHSFDQFDLSKIGTGEGAQAYGHGLYFAESEPVARNYRDALAKPMQMNDPVGNAWDLLNKGGFSKQELLDQFNQMAKAFPDRNFWQDSIEAIKSGAVDQYKPPGHMYEVDINAKPEDFLNWDKPLREQPNPAARDFLTSHGIDDRRLGGDAHQDLVDWLWRNAPGYSQPGGAMRSTDQAAAQASEQLRGAGIPGVRYLDQGSRGAGAGSHNYAIWTPEIVAILRRYGLLPPLAAGGLLAAPGQGEAGQP